MPEYVCYPAEMDIGYVIYMTSGESPDSVKFYIKDGETIIMQDNLPAVAGYDIYHWEGGTTVGPGIYTMEIEITKDGITHSDTHDFTVFELDRVCLSSGNAIESPVCWDGGDIEAGSPCDPTDTEPSLIIPHCNVMDFSDPDVIRDFVIGNLK
jgi:hypothetical protein